MNREQAKALLPIITAFAEGKEIQYRPKRSANIPTPIWMAVDHASFDKDPSCYRIKPEPMECWVNVYEDGSFGRAWATKEEASISSSCRPTRMREVLE